MHKHKPNNYRPLHADTDTVTVTSMPSNRFLLIIISILTLVIVNLCLLLIFLLFHTFPTVENNRAIQGSNKDFIVDINKASLSRDSSFYKSFMPPPPPSDINLTWHYLTTLFNITGEHSQASLQHLLTNNCRLNLRYLDRLGSGWTKVTWKAIDLSSKEHLAVKHLHIGGHDFETCRQLGISYSQCYAVCVSKFMRELVYLQHLSASQGIIRLKGWCLSDNEFYVATELGHPIDLLSLLQMPWEERLRIASDLSKLLVNLHTSSLGSLAAKDLRREQFVLVNSRLKLVDLDDLDSLLPKCTSNDGVCEEQLTSKHKIRSQCKHGKCLSHNQLSNLQKVQHQFFNFILDHGAPKPLEKHVEDIKHHLKHHNFTCKQLHKKVDNLVQAFSDGSYLNKDHSHNYSSPYTVHSNFTVIGGNFPCSHSSTADCTISAFNRHEAELLCNRELHCVGFVESPLKSWTNRTVIHLKSSNYILRKQAGWSVFIKPSHISL